MKTRKYLCMAFASLFLLTSCNMRRCDAHYDYSRVHLTSSNKCYRINSWYDNKDGSIEVWLTDYDNARLCLSDGTYILVNDFCPICDVSHKR